MKPPPGAAAAAAAPSIPIQLSAKAPAEVNVGDEVVIDVQASLPGLAMPIEPANVVGAEVQPDEQIVALLTLEGDALEVDGPRIVRLAVPTAASPDSRNAFTVRGVHEGAMRLAILFRQGGTELASIPFAMRVVTAAAGTATVGLKASAASRDKDDDSTALLLVEDAPGGTGYRYKLNKPGLWDYLDFTSPPFVAGSAGTLAYVGSLYKRITERVLQNLDDVKLFEIEMRAAGADMARQLLPPDLVRLLWPHRDGLTIHVKSWEAYLPWEIARLVHPDTQEKDDRFFAEYDLIRSFNGLARPRGLALGEWRYLIGDYPDLPELALGSEATMFTDILPELGVRATQIPATPQAFYDSIAHADFDVLHIVCHGQAPLDNAESAALVIGDRKVDGKVQTVTIEPTTMRNEANFGKRHPLVFLNACESGRVSPSLTVRRGWPQDFWDVGVAAFVGTSWPVHDVPACKFSAAFYKTLLAGETLARAAGAGRAAAKASGDATWLAYKVYADPCARRQEDP